jgi:hypothetical protein
MGFFSSFSSGNPNGHCQVPLAQMVAAMAISADRGWKSVTQDGESRRVAEVPGPSTLADQRLGRPLGNYTTVRGNDGKINVPLTVLDTAAKVAFPGYGIVRGGMGAIDAIFGPTTMTAEEAAAEQASYTALAEASLSPSIPPYLLSQGQQDPAAQQALFGPTHIYGALPGQARRRGAYQYIPPTFGPRS